MLRIVASKPITSCKYVMCIAMPLFSTAAPMKHTVTPPDILFLNVVWQRHPLGFLFAFKLQQPPHCTRDRAKAPQNFSRSENMRCH